MGVVLEERDHAAQRWAARGSLGAAVLAVVLPVVTAGVGSLLLVGAGLLGAVVTAAALWWVLTRRGVVRAAAAVLAVGSPVGVIVLFHAAQLLWVVVVSLVLWSVAVWAGKTALSSTRSHHVRVTEYETPAPERAFFLMNPRSGGGKVERFGLREKAERLGARVHLLDPERPEPEDVAALAREAVANGADLLGVAGGDGTQALVAAVAAEHDIPFLVVSAGTRNHFALDLGLDRDDPSTCLDALADGVELRVDLGFAGEHPFVNNASFGAYAAVVQSPAYRDDKVGTTLELLPDLLTGQRGPQLTARAQDAVIEAPQALLISNNPYRMDDPPGSADVSAWSPGCSASWASRWRALPRPPGCCSAGTRPASRCSPPARSSSTPTARRSTWASTGRRWSCPRPCDAVSSRGPCGYGSPVTGPGCPRRNPHWTGADCASSRRRWGARRCRRGARGVRGRLAESRGLSGPRRTTVGNHRPTTGRPPAIHRPTTGRPSDIHRPASDNPLISPFVATDHWRHVRTP
ncbi:hypothetical protein SAV14893_045150 [Streptomyces avermitilis]|uniref:DAGKc domain-containing protein n=1 Tax=Streptomyces avermitilis TaxID=33903 RepID=A0A4D4LUW4_STRAX|nr:hypothetical protein SAV14893_045150 [Streptomyces avermitilis]